jgi:hypothetical protein
MSSRPRPRSKKPLIGPGTITAGAIAITGIMAGIVAGVIIMAGIITIVGIDTGIMVGDLARP